MSIFSMALVFFILTAALAHPSHVRAQTVLPLNNGDPVMLDARTAKTFNPNFLLGDDELIQFDAMSAEATRRFLSGQSGTLARYRAADIDGVTRAASDIIWLAAERYAINPKFLIVLVQKEQGLVEDPAPSQRSYDWATGYGVCDGCSTDDPGIQEFRGFAIQVDRAAARQRYYLSHPTEFAIAVGQPWIVDGAVVIPANQATANLYLYTPHLNGNRNFWILWQRYFGRDYPDGTLLREQTTGHVWLLTSGKLRLVASLDALLTNFDPRKIIDVSVSDVLRYDISTPIRYPNYSLLRSPGGTVYLLVDEVRRGLASPEVFRGLGFNPEEVTDVSWADLSAYREGTPITTAGAKPLGELLQDKKTGAIYYVADGVRHPVLSREIIQSRFSRYPIERRSPAVLAKLPIGDPERFADGELIAALDSPTVYVIAGGRKRPIISSDVFVILGYRWSNIIKTSRQALAAHPDGPPVTG